MLFFQYLVLVNKANLKGNKVHKKKKLLPVSHLNINPIKAPGKEQ